MTAPAFPTLRDGDLVGIVAPAGPSDPDRVALVEPLLAKHGLRTRLYPTCHRREGFLAGTDDERLADLHAAWVDPEVRLVWCLRGGYGSGRLLDRLDAGLARRQPKLLVGYSDITALHAWLCHAGLPGLHAPMPGSDLVREGREADAAALFEVLRGGLRAGHAWRPERTATGLHRDGVAEGPIVGGNLSLVASLIGTPWVWPAQGAILFLEDINEEPYRVDRYLLQLRLAGVLDAAAGFLIGSFSEQASPDDVLAHYLLPTGKPVLGGWPTGHGTPNRPLPMGVRVRLDAGAGELTLLEDLIRPTAHGDS